MVALVTVPHTILFYADIGLKHCTIIISATPNDLFLKRN